jgi:3-deoxy-D-arabino-heptulosonate 7-phosphate (DAHP) synthase class II
MGRRGGVADLKRVSRILLDLKVTANYLRQYPQLAEKVESALRKGKGKKG